MFKVQNLSVANVRSVYSGIDGKCCCGCAGTHRYNSSHTVEASKDRGYEVTAKDINDKQVKKVLDIVKSHYGDRELNTEYLDAVVGERLYIIYLTHATQAA